MTESHDSLFRRTAVDHYLSTAEPSEVLRVSPPSTLTFVLVFVAAALTLALLSASPLLTG